MKTTNILLILFIITVLAFVSVQVSYAEDGLSASYQPEQVTIENGDTTLAIMRISANDTTGLHSIMLRLIGDYNPIVKDYTYTSTQGYTTHSIDIQPDWSWIMTCALFIVVIFCTFRLIGGIFN